MISERLFLRSLPLLGLALCLSLLLPAPALSASPPESGTPGHIEGVDDEPEITIIRRGDAVIEEYRVGGQLYMIKVTPRRGIPYYLVDTDGDGRLDSRRSELAEDMMIPSWTILRW